MLRKIFENKISVICLSLFVSVLWGTLFPMIKLGYKTFGIDAGNVASILVFAGLRFFISGIVLVVIVSGKEKRFEFPVSNKLKSVFFVSLLTVIVHYAFTYIGLSLSESSKSSVLKQSAFLVLPCIAFLFRKDDKFSAAKVAGSILGFLSVLAINLDGGSFVFGIGEGLVIAASFSSMFGQMASKNIYDKYNPTYIVAYSQLIGGAALLIGGFAAGGSIGTLSFASIGVLAYICIASILANVIWNNLISNNDMSRLAILKSVDPLFAAVFSAALLGENILRIEYIIALVLVISAIFISNYKRKK